MTLRSSKTFVTGALVLGLAGGAGAAYATTQAGSSPAAAKADSPFLADVAERVGVKPEALLGAMKAEATERVNAALAAGTISADRAARAKERIAASTLDRPFGPRGDRGPGHGHGRLGLHSIGEAAAAYIGIGLDELRTEVRSGKSLATVAKEHGKSVDGLKTAILDAVSKRLDGAERLTAEQKAKILERIRSRIDEIVNRSFPAKR